MKNFTCEHCDYSGTRQMVRKHLRKEHGTRGLQKSLLGQRKGSQLTKSTIIMGKDKQTSFLGRIKKTINEIITK